MTTYTPTMALPKPQLSDNVETLVNNINSALTILDAIYPIGSIYQSTVSTNPSTFLGGTWQQIEGRVLVGAGTTTDGTYSHTLTAGTTGGTVKHKHLTAEGFDDGMWYGYYMPNGDTPGFGSIVQTENTKKMTIDISEATSAQRLAYTQEKDTMPPYKCVYIWERTA